MPIDSGNLALKGLDDLFSTEEKRQEEQREQVQQIPIDELHPFTNHPFKVLDDEAMTRTVESIAQYGVLAPLIARPSPDGDGYEIISGHRRQYAAKLAGLDALPVIVRDMDDDAATILMVDSNLQREHISPSERAFAYKMKLDALKNQGARSDLTSPQNAAKFRSDDAVAKSQGISGDTVQRYVRLTNLIPELLNMVDEKKVSFNPAVELSYLSAEQQQEMIKAIIRQGNMNKEVKVFNYVTEGTFDSYLFQTLENKQRFISQIMTSKSPVRSCDDVDEQALSYAEIKALCAGNPLIKEKMDLDVQVAKLKVLKADHQSKKFRLEDKLLTKFPADIQETTAYIAGVKLDAELATAHPQEKEGFCGITIKGVTYDEKKTAGERLLLACSELPNSEEKVIGSYRGFELSLRFDTYHSEYQALLKGQRKYPVALGKDPLGCIIRLDNSLNNFPERIASAENELATLKQQQAAAQIEVEKPFPQEEELAEKSARLAELNAQLDMDEKHREPEQDEEPRRSSVLAALEEKSDKVEPIKPFKSYLDKDGDAR